MALPLLFATLTLILLTPTHSYPQSTTDPQNLSKRLPRSYAPAHTPCPSTPLTRTATGLNPLESTYIASRAPHAAAALAAWLNKTDPAFSSNQSTYPTLALASSGGGFRATLCGAGVHQAFDARDSNTSVSGLYQALSYESALSGGAWLLGALAAADWPRVSTLQEVWAQSFTDGLLAPDNVFAAVDDLDIVSSLLAKGAAGFKPTAVDLYGRLVGYAVLDAPEGGVAETWSAVMSGSGYTGRMVPFPIITAVATDAVHGECVPANDSAIFELTPVEFGSFDAGVEKFASMEWVGSREMDGECVRGFDRVSYLMGTSSNVLFELCEVVGGNETTEMIQAVLNKFDDAVGLNDTADTRVVQAVYPNPFAAQPIELTLVDGGVTEQNNPIWPFLHRPDVDVLFVNDNSADTEENFPNGAEIYQTYMRAQQVGLSRMPVIPSPDVFVVEGLNKRPTFFGCDDESVMTIVFLPNVNYTYPSNTDTAKLQYSRDQTDGIIANGNAIATYDGNETFGECVGCAIMKKTGTELPEPCEQCFGDFCFN